MQSIHDFFELKRCFGCNLKGSYFCSVCIEDFCPTKFQISSQFSLSTVSQHNPAMMRAISGWKDRHLTQLTRNFADLLFHNNPIFAQESVIQLITPPQRKNSYSKRGFNPLADLASELVARNSKLIYEERAVTFKWEPKDQRRLDSKNRASNLIQTMQANPNSEMPALLLDDVWTTGSTMRELVRALGTQTRVVGLCVITTAYKLGTKDVWS
jgi:predicted amidophosphoribosyltransferase